MTAPIRSDSQTRQPSDSNSGAPITPPQPKTALTSVAAEEPLSTAAEQLVAGSLSRATQAELERSNRSSDWYLSKVESETACLLPGDFALRAAKLGMDDAGLAQKMLTHFIDGNPTAVEVNLDNELERNPQLKEFVASRIEFEMALRLKQGEPVENMSGAVWVPQGAYGESNAGSDQRNALGGTFFEYQVNGTSDTGSLLVQLSVSDHYFWSPSEKDRATHCLHERGAGLVAAGKATEFHQFGEGTLVVNDPRVAAPMLPLATPGGSNE